MKKSTTSRIGLLAEPVWRETARAFAVFLVLSAALGAVSAQIAFRDLDLRGMERRFRLGTEEAARVREVVRALGREGGRLNASVLREKKEALESAVRDEFRKLPSLRHVEVRDRFGGVLFFLSRDEVEPAVPGFHADEIEDVEVITVQLSGTETPEGEVSVGISGERIHEELAKLRESLRIRLFVAAGVGVGLLVVGFFYVLHLLRKNRELERSRLAAERRSYVGLLASGLAHEIRNPLNAMNMNLQMLEEELQAASPPPEAEFYELLESTKSEIKRLETLANNFLAYARPAAPNFERKDVNDLLRELALFLQADFRRRELHLETDLTPMLPAVDVDTTQFRQAIMNLLVNARQVLSAGGTVRLVSRPGAGGEVVIEVGDDGPGIPEDAREKIFEVFYSSRGGGTGLGLPIARQIVERHGGTIEVDSAPDEGTVFRIRMPRRQAGVSPGTPS